MDNSKPTKTGETGQANKNNDKTDSKKTSHVKLVKKDAPTVPVASTSNTTPTSSPGTQASQSGSTSESVTPAGPNSGSAATTPALPTNSATPAISTSSLPATSAASNVNGVAITAGTFNRSPNSAIGNRTVGPGQGMVTATTARDSQKRKSTVDSTLDKRVRTTLIDDDVAVQIFREIGMTNDFLNSGKVLAWALQPEDEAFINIHDYVVRSQGTYLGVKVLSILRIMPNVSDGQAPLDFNDDDKTRGMFRMMLWHGTRKASIGSILENGLKIPTNNRGQLFGTGIYFADRISKSSIYCDGWQWKRDKMLHNGTSEAYLLLCDVLLGKIYKSTNTMPNTTSPPKTWDAWAFWKNQVEYNSIKGCGKYVPDIGWQKEIDGCVWPVGPTVANTEDRGTFWWNRDSELRLYYNEYIVYSTNQVQPKYLVKVMFTRDQVHENIY